MVTTGEVPFDGDVLSVLMQHVNTPPKNPIMINAELPEKTAKVILKALEKDPNDRYDSVGEMAKDFWNSLTETISHAETILSEPKEISIPKHPDEPKSKKEKTSSKPVSGKMIGGVVGFIVIAVAAFMAFGGGFGGAADDTSTQTNTQASTEVQPEDEPTVVSVDTTTPTNTLTSTGGITDPDLIVDPVSLPLQPVGMPFTDPVFGTTLFRVSNISDDGGFETQIYSQLQVFSSDNQYLLLDSSDGFVIRKLEDLNLVTGLDTYSWNDPRWHPDQPHVIVHFDSNEDTTVALQFTDIDTLTTTTIFTFPAEYEYIRVSQSFDELSEDGRWLSGLLTRNDGVAVIFALDIDNRKLGAELPIPDLYGSACEPDPEWGEVEPDWIGVSPLGRYLVVQWARDWSPDTSTPRCSGLETFDLQTGAFIGRVSPPIITETWVWTLTALASSL
ncbi:MAG: hypothetical protein FVQ83_13860 [Chloroflexi bacterium]|nr:hypothetical protein [Chloroflexota bacterium]